MESQSEYRMIAGSRSGEVYVVHTPSRTCSGPLRYDEQDAPLDSYQCDDDADDWMLDDSQVRVIRES